MSQSLESNNKFRFTEFDALCKLLKEYGWQKKTWGTPNGVAEYFTEEIKLSPDQAKIVVAKLNAAKSQFEEAQILIGLIQSKSKADLISSLGEQYTFRSFKQLEDALKERGVTFPSSYLAQKGNSIVVNFGAPRTLTAVAYEKLISDINAISERTVEADYRRGEIIGAAFNETPAPRVPQASTTGSRRVNGAEYRVPGAEVRDDISETVPDKSTAFREAFQKNDKFPFTVNYSEGANRYSVKVDTQGNKLMIGPKTYEFTHSKSPIKTITLTLAAEPKGDGNRAISLNFDGAADPHTINTDTLLRFIMDPNFPKGTGFRDRILGNEITIKTSGKEASPEGVDSIEKIAGMNVTESPESTRNAILVITRLPQPAQSFAWGVFFNNASKEGYTIGLIPGANPVDVRASSRSVQMTPQERQKKITEITTTIKTLLSENNGLKENMLQGILTQQGVFMKYLENKKKLDGNGIVTNSITVAEFREYLSRNAPASAAALSINSYTDAILRKASEIIPTQSELGDMIGVVMQAAQNKGIINPDAPPPPPATPSADSKDAFAANLSLPSSPLVLGAGGLLYGFFSKGKDGEKGGFLRGLKFGVLGVLVAIFGGMGSKWLKENLGYDLGFTLGEQKVGMMKLEKKVNDLKNATGANSRLTPAETTAVKVLVKEFDDKWKNEASVSPVGPIIDDLKKGEFNGKRLTDSPELNAYEEKINLYYLRAGGAIDSAELTKRLADVGKKLKEKQASSTSGADTPANPAGAAAPAAAAGSAAGAAAATADAAAKPAEKAPELTEKQTEATTLVRADARIKAKIETMKAKQKNATLDEYLKYINTECKTKKLEVFLSRTSTTDTTISNGAISVFANSSTLHPSIVIPNNFDPMIFKDIMRLYISGLSIPTQELEGEPYKKHADSVTAFQKKTWTPDDTLIDALPKIYIKL